MNKRTLSSLGLLVCSVALFIVLGICANSGTQYRELKASSSELESIKQGRTKTKIDLNIKFEKYPLFFDAGNDTFFYSLVDGNSKAFDPTVEVDNGYNIRFENKDITTDLIGNNDQINFVVYNDHEYYEYKLACTTLPLMNIEFDGHDFYKDTEQSMHLTLYNNENDINGRVTQSNGYIRLRGIMSSLFEKQGLRITLVKDDWFTENKCNLLNLRNDGDWILYAAYNDQDKVRNVFSEKIWKDGCSTNNNSEADTGTVYKYLELFINNEYYGLYALCYPIDQKTLSLKYGDAQYSVIDWMDESTISIDNYDEIFKNIKIRYGESWNELLYCYEKINSAFNDGNVDEIKKFVDIDNAIDEYIFNNLIQGRDNAYNSGLRNLHIVYKELYGNEKMFYVPWDFDLTWGNNHDGNSHNFTATDEYVFTGNVYHTTNPAAILMDLGDSETINKYHSRYESLRKGAWSDENINKIIDSLESKVYGSGAYYRDMDRWPNGSYTENSRNLSSFRLYVLDRFHYLDSQICG